MSKNIVSSIWMDKQLCKELRVIAAKAGISRSKLVAMTLEAMLPKLREWAQSRFDSKADLTSDMFLG